MSTGRKLPWDRAYKLAEQVAKELRPHVVRLKAAGSLRRRRPEVGDIEFLLEPRMIEADLFGTKAPDVASVRAALEQLGTWVKGGDRMMQIRDVLGCPGFGCDLYLVWPPAEWGSLLAIRTGPWRLGRLAMMRMRENGFRHEGGRVLRIPGNDPVPTPDEESFFRCAGLPVFPPHVRDEVADRLEAGEDLSLPAEVARV